MVQDLGSKLALSISSILDFNFTNSFSWVDIFSGPCYIENIIRKNSISSKKHTYFELNGNNNTNVFIFIWSIFYFLHLRSLIKFNSFWRRFFCRTSFIWLPLKEIFISEKLNGHNSGTNNKAYCGSCNCKSKNLGVISNSNQSISLTLLKQPDYSPQTTQPPRQRKDSVLFFFTAGSMCMNCWWGKILSG